MPFLAVFGAAAEVGAHQDATLVQPNARERPCEAGFRTDSVSAVAAEQRGIGAIELRSLEPNDVDGNTCPVFRGGESADNFGIVEVNGRSLEQRGTNSFPGRGVEAIPGCRFEIGCREEQHIAATHWHDLPDRGDRWQSGRGKRLALCVEDAHARRSPNHVNHIEVAKGGTEILDRRSVALVGSARGLRDHNLGLRQIELCDAGLRVVALDERQA